jgi:integrase
MRKKVTKDYSAETKRHATKYPGVYERQGERVRGETDTCYDISYKKDGRKVWEKAGWLSLGFTLEYARQLRIERLHAIQHDRELPREKKQMPTFKALAEKYLSWAASNRRNGAIDDKNRYELHLKERFGNKRLNEISSFDLERMKSELQKDGYSPKTISHVLGLFRSMLNRARDWGMYQGENPTSKVKKPKIQNERQRFLTHDEAAQLLEYLNTPQRKQLHDIALLSLFTACRAGEIFSLRGLDVDFNTGMIRFVDTKNGETRYIPLNETLRIMLENRMPIDRNDLIFKNRKNEKIREVSSTFDRAIKALWFNTGVTDNRQKIVFHSLRHTALSWAAIGGASLRTLAEIAGHKRLEMVKRYSHLTQEHIRETMTDIENGFLKSQKKGEVIPLNK